MQNIDLPNALFSGAIGIALGYLAKYLVDAAQRILVRDRRLKSIWGFLTEETHVFVPLIDRTDHGAAGGYGDMLALARLITMANRLFGSEANLLVKKVDFDESESGSKNIVIIGAGKHNDAYIEVIDRLRPPVHFFDTKEVSNRALRNYSGSIMYSPECSPEGAVLQDVALAVSAKSPYNPAKRVVIMAGSYTYGCVAAADFLMSPVMLAPYRKQLTAGDNFEVVLKGAVKDHAVSDIQVVSSFLTF